MISLSDYVKDLVTHFVDANATTPWDIITDVERLVSRKISTLGSDYIIKGSIAIHKKANIEEHVIFKGSVIISEDCFVASHAYIRGGVFLGPRSVIGPGTEIKSSVILDASALAHFNFIGDSIIGSSVNMEAGSVIANHFNERSDKTITIMIDGRRQVISSTKFGAVVGDGTRIGANAVLSPGTILPPGAVVKRLELVQQ